MITYTQTNLLKLFKFNRFNYFHLIIGICAIIPLSLVLSCSTKEEVKPDTKPIVIKVLNAGNVSANMVTLNAEIQYLNDEKVLDHGFLISDKNGGNPIKISLGTNVKYGLIQHEYKSSKPFPLNGSMSYKFYLNTEKQEYLTQISEFKVKDFWVDQSGPVFATLGDTLVLTGNFKQLNQNTEIYSLKNYSERITIEILKVDDHKISLKIPDNLGKNLDLVELYIRSKEAASDYNQEIGFTIIKVLGRVEFLADKPVYFGDGLKIKSFGFDSSFGGYPIIIGNTFSYSYEGKVSLSEINYTGQKMRLGYFNGIDSIFSNQKLELIKPKPADLDLTQSSYHPGQPFAINSNLLSRLYGNWDLKIKVNGQDMSSSLYNDAVSANFYIPKLKAGEYAVEILSKMYPTVKLNQKLTVKPIDAKIISAGPYYFDELVEVTGNFEEGSRYFARMDQNEMELPAAKNGKVGIRLPVGMFGNQKIFIGMVVDSYGLTFVEDPLPINVFGAVIESISPASAYAGDIVTIKGRGLSSIGYEIFIAEKGCKIIENKGNEIKFLAPNSERKGKFPVGISFYYDFKTIYSKDLLELK